MPFDVVLVDLDGTLYDTSHRDHLLETENPNKWDLFSAQCGGDTVVSSVSSLVEILSADFEIYLVSGRSKKYEAETIQKLNDDGIPFDALYLREEGDYDVNSVYKTKLVKRFRAQGDEPVLAIEDNPHTARALEEIGIPTVLVRSASRHG